MDFLFYEWNNKPCGIWGYGDIGEVCAVESLRLVMGKIKVADVRTHVAISPYSGFENFTIFKPHEKR
jgi:hypothetical protein